MTGEAHLPHPARTCAGAPILVADEVAATRLAIAQAVRSVDPQIEVIEASTGPQALEAFVRRSPPTAFLSVMLPDLSGAEALAHARSRGLRPLTVLMSALVIPRWVELSVELEAYEFLKKPFDPEHVKGLLRAIQRLRTPTRLLVVDSSATSRQLVRRLLAASRFCLDIDETDNGPHALKLMRLTRYDVALISAELAGVDGLETACQARHAAPETRCILTCASDSVAVAQIARHFGLAAVLHKPFFARDIDFALYNAFDLRRPYLLNALVGRAAPKQALAAG